MTFISLKAQDELKITWDYRDLSFNEFVVRAENTLNLRFFFKDDWVRDLRPGDYPGMTSLTVFLDNIFRDKSIFYIIDESGNVLITKDIAIKTEEAPKSADQNFLAPTEYFDAQDKQKLSGNIVVEIGNPADRNKSGNVIISGYITNRDTKEPVAGVTVFIQKLSVGTISNEYGFIHYEPSTGNPFAAVFIYRNEGRTGQLNLYGSGELNIEMNSVLIPLKETVVSAEKNVTLQRFEVGVEKINIVSFRLLPTSMGESDIIKSVLLIPGVQSVGEGSAGFNVRGGSTDQNLILFMVLRFIIHLIFLVFFQQSILIL